MPKLIRLTVPEINEERAAVLQAMNNPDIPFVFLTGKAGTGKSTLLRYFMQSLEKKPVLLSPTGVAAVNIKGATIHSFFKLPVRSFTLEDMFPLEEELFKSFDTLIIDEVSMVRSDLMYVIDRSLRSSGDKLNRRIPFGGKKVIVMGDLCQLAPVVRKEDVLFKRFLENARGEYFFDSPLMPSSTLDSFELQTVFRQKDGAFIQALNSIRYGEKSAVTLQFLNQAVHREADESVIRLCTRNADVATRNAQGFEQLKGKAYIFEAEKEGEAPRDLLVPERLELKVGCRVMLCANVMEEGKPYFSNGELGTVRDIDLLRGIVHVKKDNGDEVDVRRFAYKNLSYDIDKKTGSLEQSEKGSLRQYPLKLAYAISIHKSQGVTLERAHIDLGQGCFAHGQLYVALSRIKSFEGLSLERAIRPSDIIMDRRIKELYQ
ncbi:AAA family ATPase [Cytophagales bacterium LB-30]|uniref:AAA family ATPase n=1 Tax=Shiella aurantiaca TaxID=3058365 RepID=A0ABT8F9D1_9BACT|nr:AAA family ATPase [Shiella aurantiaca]MDN4166854.1 AAA family ATPase [Shiella aurantiaca]